MHPSGIQFGLSRGLLQLRGEEVLLSDQLLEAISLEAQLHLHLGRPPIDGNFLVDITVRAAQNALGNQQEGRRQEIAPFFAHLNRTMYYTPCRVAERAGSAAHGPGCCHPRLEPAGVIKYELVRSVCGSKSGREKPAQRASIENSHTNSRQSRQSFVC